ncbi:M1 family metallopeptidase [Komagataeibacter xylinus]|uniref:M1 family metallopeptidase n=1 Tax=Komagataeibacter xylinus TaxID=28448 RepID=UPI000B2E7723|nr:M1 family metallopeptidase [Komagataeibacter xylinus]
MSAPYTMRLCYLMACGVLVSLSARPVRAQGVVPDPNQIFSPVAMPTPVSAYRSGDGTPGPMAWKNQADYRIAVTLDPATHELTGEETVTYHNNSPSSLPVLWVQLDQNMYRADSRRAAMSGPAGAPHTDGMQIGSVTLMEGTATQEVTPLISDTRMQITLPHPLAPGRMQVFRVRWHYTMPGAWGGRTAVSPSKNGDIYEIAQFYPRMAVFDDVRGWDTLPYVGDEFYLDYGSFDYAVTVPASFLVVGSGALVNPAQVLSPAQQLRLAQARRSDTRVMIRDLADVEAAAHAPPAGSRTWRFHMDNTRDVAFVASPALLWDAAKLDLPPMAPAPGMKPEARLGMSVYPVEGVGPQAWDRSTEYVRHTIAYFSHDWYPYPWPTAINVGGHGAGMEYPGIVFDGMHDRDAKLFWITTHELGHTWFPMIVGSNERRNGFMDEGFNTFIDSLASLHFNNGEFAPKHDGEYAPDTGRPADDIVKVLRDPVYRPLMAPSYIPGRGDRHALPYFKAAYGLELLRSQILGPARFDPAFRHYIAAWAYRHPTPSDFFRLMESDAGEDLSWFWRGWYFTNAAPDYALAGLEYVGNDPEKGVRVTVRNKGTLPLPVTLQVTWADGTTTRRILPTEIWTKGNEAVVTLPGGRLVRSASLDPDHAIPDIDRSNNESTSVAPVAAGMGMVVARRNIMP